MIIVSHAAVDHLGDTEAPKEGALAARWLGSRASVDCFPESLGLLASGKIQYPKVATQVSMWDAPAVFEKLAKDPSAMHKGVLVID